jgi:hypothetical protein
MAVKVFQFKERLLSKQSVKEPNILMKQQHIRSVRPAARAEKSDLSVDGP